MGVRNPNTTAYEHPDEPNLLNLHKAMDYDVDGKPVLRVDIGSDININGDVNIPGTVTVNSTPEDPVHTHITEVGTSGVLTTDYLPVGGTVSIGSDGTVSLSATTLSALENITVSGSVSVSNFPATQAVTGTFWQATQPVSGTVTATITDVITVVVNDDAGEIFGLNNHDTNVHRGWMMDDVMRPVISIRLNPATTTSATLMKIIEYEIGNNNANQSTIMYEWYEGDLTIAGAAIPAWSTVHDTAATQYRVYQDRYSSNQGNTFTHPSAVMRHSGIIIGKNTEGDGIAKALTGGATGKTWTLCMKRLDNSTELDVWFAFTFKELT